MTTTQEVWCDIEWYARGYAGALIGSWGGGCTFLHLHAMRGNPNLNASQLCLYGDARFDASEISQQDFAPSSEPGVSAFK